MSHISDDILMHYGVKRRSGRYPWGSGEDPYQHGRDLIGRIEELKKNGWTETPENIKKEFGMSTTVYRAEKARSKAARRAFDVARAKSLQEDGLGYTEIGRKMGINESSVRSLLNVEAEKRMNKAQNTAKLLKEHVDAKGMIDVGKGVEIELGVSKENMIKALRILQDEGYEVHGGRIPQATNPGKYTTQSVLCVPGTPHKAIWDFDKVHTINDYTSHDGGETFDKLQYPASFDSKRLKIRYAEEGGIDMDGIVQLRRGVDDISLGDSRYSQVRILVDGTHYIKGMAVYADDADMPDGVDVVFNTNKSVGTDMKKVLKPIKEDPDNPFGALIKPQGQRYYIDENGERKLSPINRTRDEGDWNEWKDALPSQFLSKQPLAMAKKQLNLAKIDKMDEFEDICALTNPTVKKHFLAKFADSCDSAAVDLQAAALPGQKYHVIIPVGTLKDNEVYAPGYPPGTKLALIRYPHGGIFEIPVLTVNNKNPLAKKVIGTDVIDAVGINAKVAAQLSGADFDGDTVMCIPTHDPEGRVKIAHKHPLKELEGFDPKEAYPEKPGMVYMKNPVTKKDRTGMEMGMISNLITDMTLANASDDELARAVRHSMVVIDAGKHKLDYKQSEVDNRIAELRLKYQTKARDDNGDPIKGGGASTIISRSKGETSVLKRQGTPKVNMPGKPWYDPSRPEGALIYNLADDVEYTVPKVNKRTGEVTYKTEYRKQKSTRMAEVDDAYELVSDYQHPMELVYADYANYMKSLANRARKEQMTTEGLKVDKAASKAYASEVSSLNEKLKTALLNTPRERAAQRAANVEVKAKKEANPEMSKKDIKKQNQMAITKYRKELGAVARRDRNIDITDREWEAIQAGAVSESTLTKILANTDTDALRQRSMPRSSKTLNQAKINRIKAMRNSNYTVEQIANKLGVPTSTVSSYLKGDN